ncbi:hypothetical protein M959_03165, partial [Chaetura pelagica]
VGTQTELPSRHAAVQVSGCSECLSLALVSEGTSDSACVRCEQVNDLLRQVVELTEEVARLRAIREYESEIDGWSQTLRQGQIEDVGQVTDPFPSCHQTDGEDSRDIKEWKEVRPRRGKKKSSQPLPPSQLPLKNRYEALEIQEQENEVGGVNLPSEVPRTRQSPRVLRTSSIKKERRVIVVGDSLLRGTEGPICRPDPSHREVCCLPGARIRDVKRKLPNLVNSSDYYPLLIFQVGSDEIITRNVRAMKRDFRALGQLVRGSGAQVVFASIPPARMGREVYRKSLQVNEWLRDWCHSQGFGFFDHGMLYEAPGLMVAGGMHLSQRGKRLLGQDLAGLIDRALN